MIKQLAKSIREYTKDSVLAPVFVILEAIMEVAIPMLMANIIDYGITGGNMNYLVKMGLIMVLCAIFSLLFGILSGRHAAVASSGFAKNLRKDMYYNVQDFSFSNIDRFSTASLITRLTTDVSNVQNSFQMIIRLAVRCPVMLVFALIMSFSINARLSLIFLGAAVILIVGLYLIIKNVHPLFEKVFRTYDKLNSVVQENLRGIRVVKSFVREDHEVEKFKSVSERIYALFTKAQKLIALNNPLMQFVIYACSLLLSWLGARMIVGGSMTTGHLMSLLAYQMQILMSLMMLSMVFVMMIMSRASAERITEVLTEQSDIANPENPVYTVADGSITFEQVDFQYVADAENSTLENITLSIQSGQTVGIIGGTGTGKSSLVQLIPRLYDINQGSLRVGGVEARDYDVETLRQSVAMVLQQNVLFSGSIKENLRWGNAQATDDELTEMCKIAQADDFIRAFPDGYDTHIEQGGTNVSGGQRQRLCIARALLKNPKVLILDDSTSAVDTKTDQAIRRSFREELANITKLIIAQRISSIEDADQIVVLDDGKINAVGTHDTLLASNKIYQEVYYSQTKEADEDAV